MTTTAMLKSLTDVSRVSSVPVYAERDLPSARSDGGSSPRLVIRGESSLSIDWLSFTFPALEDWQSWLESALAASFGLRGFKLRTGGLNGYTSSATIGGLAVVAWGGECNKRSVYVSIPGSVTGAVGGQAWESIATLFAGRQARITRCDLAFDDFLGKQVTVKKALTWYKAGKFTSGGRPPAARLLDDLGTGKGSTLYVGRRENGKLLRVYEKGKQLGSPDSKWVRVELQLGNRDRVIPWDVLTRPGDVLAGAYPCLDFISAHRYSVKASKATHMLKLAHCIKHAKLQAGPLLHALLRIEQGDIGRVFDQVCQWGRIPRRLDPTFLQGT